MNRRLTLSACAALLLSAGLAQAAYSPSTTNGWFITGGRVAGLGGSLFRMDVWLFNPDASSSATVTLVLHPAVGSGQSALPAISSSPLTLAPRETRFLADVTLATIPAGDGVVGSVEWRSDNPILGAGRIYTFSPTGTYGFFLAAVPQAESMGARDGADDTVHVLQIFGMNSGDPNFRTNVDLTNTSGVTLPVEVRVIDPTTSEIIGGTQEYSVAPGSLVRLGQDLVTVAAPLKDGLRITVAVREGTVVPSGGILAAAYTLDNRTQDAFAFVGQRQSP